MTKEEARAYCRKGWTSFLAAKSPQVILEKLALLLDELKSGARLLVSMPLKNELDYWKLLAGRDLQIYAPRTLKDKIEFRYYEIGHPEFSQIEAGHQGIAGPGAHAPLLEEPLQKEDQIILPCLGVGAKGARLGRGGGYYDRWREKLSIPRRIALVPEALARLDFPAEGHDIYVQCAVTEKGMQYYA